MSFLRSKFGVGPVLCAVTLGCLFAGALPARGQPAAGSRVAQAERWRASREQGLAALRDMGRSLQDLQQILRSRAGSEKAQQKVRALRAAHARVTRQLAGEKPPRAGAPPAPDRYTEFVETATPLLRELRQDEHEHRDLLDSLERSLATFRRSSASMREAAGLPSPSP